MVDGLGSLIIAGIAFCGSHVLLSSTGLRGSLRDQLGERGFLAVYSLTALATFAWFLLAYSHTSDNRLVAPASVDGPCPGRRDAVSDNPVDRRLHDPQSDRRRDGAIGQSR